MSSTTDKLVRMMNQIAVEFGHQQRADAATATWDHIWHFWDPDMRKRILAYDDVDGTGLNATARLALAKLRDGGRPAPQSKATDFTSGRNQEPGSDAG
ncbi:MAG: formate dehydrogenase [Sphingomonas bacterium]|uniref:formate dehydrogenase subunit delta n=1 Tax=Sphingomonas bacterium TaxID=1895847 RepID=UPI0026199414|nr:formate dehydrogenase subunit delta [Sphingomonas bacterium]MDB5712525.1 formate dehydrogenase [Sphingomonas bacterium]